MSGLPSSKGCRFRPGSLGSLCSTTQFALEGESHNRRPDCSHDHQELHELDFPTSRFKASKQTKMQEQDAHHNKQYAATLDETKVECWFVHFLILAKRAKRRLAKSAART
jgi:hypothetical protein